MGRRPRMSEERRQRAERVQADVGLIREPEDGEQCPECGTCRPEGVLVLPSGRGLMPLPCPACYTLVREEWRQEALQGIDGSRAGQIEALMARVGVDVSVWRGEGWETWATDRPAGPEPLRQVRALLQRYLRGERGGLYLWGDTGAGKTHLAVGLVRAALLEQSVDPDGIRYVRAAVAEQRIWRSSDRVGRMAELSSVPLLVIDELHEQTGKLPIYDWWAAIVESRTNRHTLITSNLSPAELADSEPGSIDRLTDRITGTCRIVEVAGTSQRDLLR